MGLAEAMEVSMSEYEKLWNWLHESDYKWDCVSDDTGVVRIIFFVDEDDEDE